MAFSKVASLDEMNLIDDAGLPHNYGCLVENYSWFFIDRECVKEDDRNLGPAAASIVDTKSGNGRWIIMTPQTARLGADLSQELGLLEAGES